LDTIQTTERYRERGTDIRNATNTTRERQQSVEGGAALPATIIDEGLIIGDSRHRRDGDTDGRSKGSHNTLAERDAGVSENRMLADVFLQSRSAPNEGIF
jgi:hypothetical protein